MSATRDHRGRPVVAVTGYGMVSSLGQGVAESWAGLTAGRSGIKRIGRFATDNMRTTIAGAVDYLWQDGYATVARSSGAYSPDSSDVPAQKSINLRLGFERGRFDVNLFALNITDERVGPRFGGRSQCTNADCSTYNSYTYGATVAAPLPRQIGVQLAYRH